MLRAERAGDGGALLSYRRPSTMRDAAAHGAHATHYDRRTIETPLWRQCLESPQCTLALLSLCAALAACAFALLTLASAGALTLRSSLAVNVCYSAALLLDIAELIESRRR